MCERFYFGHALRKRDINHVWNFMKTAKIPCDSYKHASARYWYGRRIVHNIPIPKQLKVDFFSVCLRSFIWSRNAHNHKFGFYWLRVFTFGFRSNCLHYNTVNSQRLIFGSNNTFKWHSVRMNMWLCAGSWDRFRTSALHFRWNYNFTKWNLLHSP